MSSELLALALDSPGMSMWPVPQAHPIFQV